MNSVDSDTDEELDEQMLEVTTLVFTWLKEYSESSTIYWGIGSKIYNYKKNLEMEKIMNLFSLVDIN